MHLNYIFYRSSHCWAKASPIFFQVSLLAVHRVQHSPAPVKPASSSRQRVAGRPTPRVEYRGHHSVSSFVHLPSVCLMIWPAHFHFSFLAYRITSVTLVNFLSSVLCVFSISFLFNTLLSILR
ncbi:hypothetical protein JYU34_008225 [Plutella xylostella]|uniref:Uncharacterized protein n=1 Tax=Plutella xylostella TaxID=51655 RepID=A0ABQ7QP39_PLUXY|nr:hypothetical protein JYU34_008225 [Plutella xylostella]